MPARRLADACAVGLVGGFERALNGGNQFLTAGRLFDVGGGLGHFRAFARESKLMGRQVDDGRLAPVEEFGQRDAATARNDVSMKTRSGCVPTNSFRPASASKARVTSYPFAFRHAHTAAAVRSSSSISRICLAMVTEVGCANICCRYATPVTRRVTKSGEQGAAAGLPPRDSRLISRGSAERRHRFISMICGGPTKN